MKRLKHLIPIIALVALMATSSVTFAHKNDEWVPTECTEAHNDLWFTVSAACDPNNPPDISDGILHSLNIAFPGNNNLYPRGLCYPSFNNYIDSAGLAPFGPNPLFQDETNFFLVANQPAGQENIPAYREYGDEVTVNPGDTLHFMMYIHNNGDTCFNNFPDDDPAKPNFPRAGKVYENWNTTAENTSVRIIDGDRTVPANGTTDFQASIRADNAITPDGQVGASVLNGVTLRNNTGEEIELEYVEGSAWFYDYTYVDFQDGQEPRRENVIAQDDPHNMEELGNIDLFFGFGGYPLGSLRKGEFKAGAGDYFASEPYIGLIIFEMEAPIPRQADVCLNLDVEEDLTVQETLEDGTPLHKLDIVDLEYEGEVPFRTLLRWTTSDPEGEFFIKEGDNFFRIAPLEQDGPTTVISSMEDATSIYYKGERGVVVGVMPQSGGTAECVDQLAFINEDEPQVCEQMLVDHEHPIFENRLTSFTARAIGDDGNVFGNLPDGKNITYFVEPGHGLFFLEQPIGIVPNEGEQRNEGADLAEEFLRAEVEQNPVGWLDNIWEAGRAPINPFGNNIFNTDLSFGQAQVPNPFGGDNPEDPAGIGEGLPGAPGPGPGPGIPEGPNNDPLGNGGGALPIPEGLFGELDGEQPLALPESFDKITVDHGDKVWFWALEEGNNVIQLSTEKATDNKGCRREFDIEPPLPEPPVCESATLVAETITNQGFEPTECLAAGARHRFTTEFFAEGQVIDPDEVTVLWRTTDPTGVFFSEDGSQSTPGQAFVGLTVVEYEGSGRVTGELMDANDIALPNPSQCEVTIRPCDNECAAISVDSNPASPFLTGQDADLFIRGTLDLFGNPLPDGTLVTFSTNTDGTFSSDGANSFNPIEVPLSETGRADPIDFSAATQPGTITIEVTDPEFASSTGQCTWDLEIVDNDLVCIDLELVVREGGPDGPPSLLRNLSPGTLYYITATANYNRDTENNIWVSTEHGVLINDLLVFLIGPENLETITAEEVEALVANPLNRLLIPNGGSIYFLTYSDISENTDSAIHFEANDGRESFTGDQCFADLPLRVDEPVCEELGLKIFDLFTDPNNEITPQELKPNNPYKLNAAARYSQDLDNTVTYSSDHGVFLTQNEMVIALATAMTAEMIAADTPSTTLDQEIANGEDIYFLTNSDIPETVTDALQVKATGFFNPECNLNIPIIVEPGVCVDLSLDSVGGFNPATDQTLSLSGDFRQHQGTITVTTNDGTISKLDEDNFGSTVTFDQDEISDPDTSFAIAYRPDPNYDSTTDTVTITAKATGTGAGICEDTISVGPQGVEECIDLEIVEPDTPWEVRDGDDERIEIRVSTNPSNLRNDLYYHWEIDGQGEWEDSNDDYDRTRGTTFNDVEDVDEDTRITVWATKSSDEDDVFRENGTQVCIDSIRARDDDEPDDDEEPPEIEKLVYRTDQVDDADDFINIGQKNNRFTSPDKYVTYAVIFEPGSDVGSVEILENNMRNGRIDGVGSLGGHLSFQGMRINVIDDDRNDEYTILRTRGYESDNERGNKISDRDYDDDDDYDLDDYEDKYECNGRRSQACIDGDFEDAVEDFIDGDALRIGNLDEDMTIIVKYQMKNNSVIDDRLCQRLTAAQGCGEQFDNKVEFESYESHDFKRNNDDGDDDATVIVICPFILTRGGGDIFFHDIIDTGIDVAQCSEVKGGTGTTIKRRPPPDQTTPTTGAGGEDSPLTLELPSHDICRYSNLDSNIEGYNDVLENFSSTVCELEADVAEEWTETYIVNAISANLRRIARFDDNLPNTEIRSMNDLSGISDNGVYVKRGGDIVIDLGSNTIGAADGVPANQTYIVEDGDIIIKSNINYANADYTNLREIPSAAFIAINGNIIIQDNVTQIDGTLMAVDLDRADSNDSGKVLHSGERPTTNLLFISGNLIGDVYDLFDARRGVGDPTKDEGSVTIRYNENLLLNPPPGLSELVDIAQFRGI